MGNNELINDWIRIAEMDYESAVFLQGMYPKPLEIICYHCQQSAEKFLKAFLIFHKQVPPKIHDLGILNQECCRFDETFLTIQTECVRLTNYAVNIRYPYLLDVTEFDMQIALNNATTIKNFVLSKLTIE